MKPLVKVNSASSSPDSLAEHSIAPCPAIQISKQVIQSALLNREAHMDVITVGGESKMLFILMGGSGVDQREYTRRSTAVHPALAPMFAQLDTRGLNLTFVHITAPPDIPYAHWHKDPSTIGIWNNHVTLELLAQFKAIPYFISGFSGGAALAFNGLHTSRRCFGGAGFGADALPENFAKPPHWAQSLWLVSTQYDRVSNSTANRSIARRLDRDNQAELYVHSGGSHSMEDYAQPQIMGGRIRMASNTFDQLSIPKDLPTRKSSKHCS